MTEVKKSLTNNAAGTTASVAAIIDFTRRQKLIELRLEGTILSEQVEALREFLRDLSCFRGNQWKLHLENLDAISMRALRVLAKFAREVRRRGYNIEVVSIQPAILATFLDLGMHELFTWETLKGQYDFFKIAQTDELSLPAFGEEKLTENSYA
jgi:anti-anti-sigma factor